MSPATCPHCTPSSADDAQTSTPSSPAELPDSSGPGEGAALTPLLVADLSGLDLVALMVDGVHFGEHTCVVALGIDIDGTKHPLSLVRARRRTPPWSPS